MNGGLVSVSFRQLNVAEIISLANKAGLKTIEWGTDVHVPNHLSAAAVCEQMEEAGLYTASLGSYYRAGEGQDFAPVLETALALSAPSIRVWAGTLNSQDASPEYRRGLVRDLQAVCRCAGEKGLKIALEYHGNTLTNHVDSCLRLLEETGMDNLYSYWQPLESDFKPNMESLKALCGSGRLLNLHVYHWVEGVRRPLKEGGDRWSAYLKLARDHAANALLEFVQDDSPQRFLEDAKILTGQIAALESGV